MKNKLSGLATGIGSFPTLTAEPALNLIFNHIPELPHWPQLPAKGSKEGLVRQYLSPLLEFGLLAESPRRSPFFLTGAEEWLELLTDFYSKVLENHSEETIASFGLPQDVASGFYAFLHYLQEFGVGPACCLKGQLTGPLTIGIVVTDEEMQPAFYHHDLREIIVRSLAMQICWQARTLKQFGLPVILFLDEPGLYGYGQASFVGLSKHAIQHSLKALIDVAHSEDIMIGIHACAGVDWSLLFELPFDIINIDMYNYFTSLLPYVEECNNFLARGGYLAWGIVPTSVEVQKESVSSLLKRLDSDQERLATKGVDYQTLRKQLLITPSCGTGTLTLEQTTAVYRLLQELREQYQK
ncbi:MAG: hypothetical protein GX893_00700 [Firmicutes bacterium]|nr:hypothetical protein [Bacillota bacterium]